jgi:hypothetical protein
VSTKRSSCRETFCIAASSGRDARSVSPYLLRNG